MGVDRVVALCLARRQRPVAQDGVYMGVFNFFIVIPQLVAASVLSDVLKPLLGGQPIYVLLVGAVSFALAGLLALRVK